MFGYAWTSVASVLSHS